MTLLKISLFQFVSHLAKYQNISVNVTLGSFFIPVISKISCDLIVNVFLKLLQFFPNSDLLFSSNQTVHLVGNFTSLGEPYLV